MELLWSCCCSCLVSNGIAVGVWIIPKVGGEHRGSLHLGNSHDSWGCHGILCSLHAVTHWDWDKIAATLQTAFSNAFSWKKIYVFWLKFQWNMFLRVQLTISQHWFRYRVSSKHVPRWPLLEAVLWRIICVTRPQWVTLIVFWLMLEGSSSSEMSGTKLPLVWATAFGCVILNCFSWNSLSDQYEYFLRETYF